MELRRGWLHIVQDFRMLPVFVGVGMALGVEFRKICGVSTEACPCKNPGRV